MVERKDFHTSEKLIPADDYGKEMAEHEANGYQRGYQDASAHYQEIVRKLTQQVIQKYHNGYNNGYGDGYDVSKGGKSSRLNPPDEKKINVAVDTLFEVLEETKPPPRLKAKAKP